MGDPVTETPEWIDVGAEVVLLVDNRRRDDVPTFYRATVGKLAKQSFVVAFGRNGTVAEERIRFSDLCSKDFGGTWNHWRYRVLAPDSAEVAHLEALAARGRSREGARRAMRDLIEKHDNARMDDLTLLREAVVALTAHADLVLAQDTPGLAVSIEKGEQT